MSDYLVEVQITLPRGEGLDDWGYVGKFFADVSDSDMSIDLLKLSSKVATHISKFEKEDNYVPRTVSIPVQFAD